MTPLAERNAKIVRWATENPCSSLEQIGRYYGISRERVRQVIAKAGKHKIAAQTARPPRRICEICGDGLTGDARHYHQQCKQARAWVTVICDGCGISFQKRANHVIRAQHDSRYTGRIFCSVPCARRHPSEAALAYLHSSKPGAPRWTHCKRGHPLTEENTYTYQRGRQCKTCANARNRVHYEQGESAPATRKPALA